MKIEMTEAPFLIEKLLEAKEYDSVIDMLHGLQEDNTTPLDSDDRKWVIEWLCRVYIKKESYHDAKRMIEKLKEEYRDADTKFLVRELTSLNNSMVSKKIFDK